MTTWTTRIVDVADLAEERRDDITVTVEDPGGQPAVYVTRRVKTTCEGCGQPLDFGRPGPVTWIDQGREIGTWNHQHGCGQWNTPVEVSAPVGEKDDPDDVVTRLIDELDDVVAEERATVDERTRRNLREQLTDALALLADGADACEVTTGSEVDPGVHYEPRPYRDGEVVDGAWTAWAYAADDKSILEVWQWDL